MSIAYSLGAAALAAILYRLFALSSSGVFLILSGAALVVCGMYLGAWLRED